ncbi:MAG: hypothetical protein ABSF44_09875 [Candidatus Bathyarchaeia archaeon]
MTESPETQEKKKQIEKTKTIVGFYLLAAIFVLIAIASVTYFEHLNSVLLKTVLYVGVAGGLGGVFYGIRGFIYHTSEDDFDPKWRWWYLYHPVTGFVLGVLAYFLIVGGLLTLGSVSQVDYTKGILLYCSISFLAGFSAKKFNEKLDELASTIFSTSSSASTKTASTAANLVVSDFPNPVTAGMAGSVKVTAKDAKGKLVTTYTGTVKITSSDNQATLPKDCRFQPSDKGVYTFTDVTLNTTGSQSITATDSQNGSITGSQTAITVNKAAS